MRSALALLLSLEPGVESGGRGGPGGRGGGRGRPPGPTWRCSTSRCPAAPAWTRRPRSGAALPACRVLILTTFGRPGYLRRAMEAGASGFLVKDSPVEELAAAIRRVLAGERVVDPALAAAALAAGPDPLTDRERDVLAAAADGSTIADIAARLHLSESTVAQLPVQRHRQDRHPQPHRGRPGRPGQRLAVDQAGCEISWLWWTAVRGPERIAST